MLLNTDELSEALDHLEKVVAAIPEDLTPYHGSAVLDLDMGASRLEALIKILEAKAATRHASFVRDHPDRIPPA